jgi:hypothetical protein
VLLPDTNTIAQTSQNSRKQINLDSNSSQSYEFDPVDRHETHLSTISASPGKGLIAALLQQEFEHSANVAVVLDEHDSAVKDAFNPSLLSPSEEGYDALSLITFDGDADLQHRCKDLCRRYQHIFRDSLDETPADLPPFDFKIDSSKWKHSRNRGPARVQTPKKQEMLSRHLTKLQAKKLIEHSVATEYSQVLIAPKGDDGRFCVDFRNLNDCSPSASWPIPNIKQMLARLGTKKADTFGVMDLTSGYHQAPLSEATKHFTAFICFAGLFQFTRLPFGPKGAPSYFQQMMATVVLTGLIYMICELYLDDVIVFGTGNDQFLERLEQVFHRFSVKHIFLQPKKCKFGLKRVEYCGKQISKEGISMSAEKINAIQLIPKPMTNTTLRSFIGAANWFRDFVPGQSMVMKPLQDMILHSKAKSHKITWTAEGEVAFEEIRRLIRLCPLMHFLDGFSPIVLMTDASDYGIGGILTQQVGSGKPQPIGYFSKSLTEVQLRWSTIQKEAYAIFCTILYFAHLLRDVHFTVKTDHRNLTFLKEDSNSMVVRWNVALQEFDYSVEFVKGVDNDIADALSRLCINRLDPDSFPITSATVSAALIPSENMTAAHRALIEDCHNAEAGHGGVERTIQKLLTSLHGTGWLHLRQDVKQFIAECPCCQKMSHIKLPIHTIRYITSTYTTMECLNIDFVGPFPDDGYILVIVDTFTRWVELFACSDNTAQSALKCLLEHFGRFGCPRAIRSDRGPHFANTLIKAFLQITGTRHNLTLAYSSEENAIVERINKEVNRHITAYVFDHDSAAEYQQSIPFVQRIINSSYIQRTRISPAQLLFGNQINLDLGIVLPFPEREPVTTSLPKTVSEMISMQDTLVETSRKLMQLSDAKHLDSSHQTPTVFEIGSYVLVHHRSGKPNRLNTHWLGPMKIIQSENSEYLLLNLTTGKEKLYHVTSMKKFKFDPLHVKPADISRKDYLEFFVEAIVAHRGDFRKVSTLSFEVKWLGYPTARNTWEPWKSLRTVPALHAYLTSKNQSKLIPKDLQTN